MKDLKEVVKKQFKVRAEPKAPVDLEQTVKRHVLD